jgi:hypothetical protein
MEKQEIRQARRSGQQNVGRMVREPISAEQRAELLKNKPRWSCWHCMFCLSDVMLWAQTLLSGFPIVGQCANHPDTPGRIRPVPGRICRNFRLRVFRVDPPAPPDDTVRYIPLTRGLCTLVDAADYEWLSQYKWYAGKPTRAGKTYARRNLPGGGEMLMHRMIMQPPKDKVVDHLNGNSLDNRRCNLYVCTQTENIQNSRPRCDATSRFRGVYPRDGKWYGRITHKGQRYNLGTFDDEIEAAKARDRKARELYGEHAWRNIPPEEPEAEGQQPPDR